MDISVLLERARNLKNSVSDAKSSDILAKNIELLTLLQKTRDEKGIDPPIDMVEKIVRHLDLIGKNTSRPQADGETNAIGQGFQVDENPLFKSPEIEMAFDIDDTEYLDMCRYFMVLEHQIIVLFSEYHLKLDYRNNTLRNSHLTRFDRIKKYMGDYLETVRDYNLALEAGKKSEYRKRMQSSGRVMLVELNEFLSELVDFLEKLISESHESNTVVLNAGDMIISGKMDERPYVFTGYKVSAMLIYIHEFLLQYREMLNVPDFAKKSNNSTPKLNY